MIGPSQGRYLHSTTRIQKMADIGLLPYPERNSNPWSQCWRRRKRKTNVPEIERPLRSVLCHYATSRKVAGLIPDEVIGFFNWPDPSSRTMVLGSTQPLTEMSKTRPASKADSLTAICEPIFQEMWEPRRLTACYRDSFTVIDIHVSQ
jgi:hypothetical protein